MLDLARKFSGEHARRAAGVEEHDRFVRAQLAAAHVREQRRHCLPRVARIEQDAFRASEDRNRIETLSRRNPVTVADEIVVGEEVVPYDRR
jgi:hypothetical protein